MNECTTDKSVFSLGLFELPQSLACELRRRADSNRDAISLTVILAIRHETSRSIAVTAGADLHPVFMNEVHHLPFSFARPSAA